MRRLDRRGRRSVTSCFSTSTGTRRLRRALDRLLQPLEIFLRGDAGRGCPASRSCRRRSRRRSRRRWRAMPQRIERLRRRARAKSRSRSSGRPPARTRPCNAGELNGCSGFCLRASSKACSPMPSKVTALRKRAGMMRSVSMSLPVTGMPRPDDLAALEVGGRAHFEDLPHVGDGAGDRGGGDHGRAHQQRAAGRAALPADEVAVAGRRAHLAAHELVVDSCPGTSSSRPCATGSPRPGRSRAGPRPRRPSRPAASPARSARARAWPPCPSSPPRRRCADRTGRPLVHEPTNADVDLGALDRLARLEAHVRERLAEGRPLGLGLDSGAGIRWLTPTDISGLMPHVTTGSMRRCRRGARRRRTRRRARWRSIFHQAAARVERRPGGAYGRPRR